MKFYYYAFFGLYLSLSCCKNNSSNNVLSDFDISPDTKAVLIVPLDGCSGCAKKSLEFIKGNQAKPFVQYILSESNRKNIAIHLNSANIEQSKSIIADASNKCSSLGLTNGYPTICYLNSTPMIIKKLSAENIEDELIILSSNIDHWSSTTEICEFDALDIKPSYVGGMNKFYSFISSNVEYPHEAKNSNIEGKAIIELVIGDEGSIQKATVLKDFYNCCGEEFQKAILQSPRWIPGEKNGKKVSSRMILPVSFKLE